MTTRKETPTTAYPQSTDARGTTPRWWATHAPAEPSATAARGTTQGWRQRVR